jgi:hypothetical protein
MDQDEYVRRAIRIAGEMKSLADDGETQARDSSCAVLFGVIRDCAYKIQGRAEREAEMHRLTGMWNEQREGPAREGRNLSGNGR